VLHVFGRMQPGGAEVRLTELIGRLSNEFSVDVCALSGKPGALDDVVRAQGGSVFLLPLTASFPVRFLSLLRRGHYRAVHSHVLHASGPILALAAAAGVPVRIAHFHAMHDGKRTTLPRRLQRRVTCALIDWYATDIISCGEGSMDAVWRAGWRADRRCRVVYDALDPARFELPPDGAAVRAELGVPAAAPMFLHVGNVAAEKNHARLLRIFAAIRHRHAGARLVLAGAGTNEPRGPIAQLIRDLALTGSVRPLGLRSDVPRLLHAADALLLPSVREGLPGVVLEACAVGLPVLATDLPGVREIAERLSLVRYLPLDASDDEWAAVALGLPAAARELALRSRAAAAFRPSVFHVDVAADVHRWLWRGDPPAMDQACS
jgi:glycosyltransferase involved in cell wall biosynthesis